jgi:hypothetical protein
VPLERQPRARTEACVWGPRAGGGGRRGVYPTGCAPPPSLPRDLFTQLRRGRRAAAMQSYLDAAEHRTCDAEQAQSRPKEVCETREGCCEKYKQIFVLRKRSTQPPHDDV